jgi:hypothetical protein
LAATATTLFFGMTYGLAYGACVGLSIGTMTGLCFGGIDALNHYFLRLILARRGVAPLGVGSRLETGVTTGILRRVGSGYMFMHAMLQHHVLTQDWSADP